MDLTMETTMNVKREKNGQYAKGTRSPNPNGRPKKAKVSESTSAAREFINFANTPQQLIKNGQPVFQSPSALVMEKFFGDTISGKASSERYLAFLIAAEAAERKRQEEFADDAIWYKLHYTAIKKKQKPGTPWDRSIGPDPDLLLVEDGRVICLDPLFADQDERAINATYVRQWQDKRDHATSVIKWLDHRRGRTNEPWLLKTLDDDIELEQFKCEFASYMMGLRETPPERPRSWQPFDGEIPYDEEIEGPIAAIEAAAAKGGSNDGSAEA